MTKTFRVEVQRIMRTIYEIEASDEKAAIEALLESELEPLVDEETDSEIIDVKVASEVPK